MILYQGIFFSPSDLAARVEGTLVKVIDTPHITFKFKPTEEDLFPASLVGEEILVTFSGYGCDGRNQRFLVEIPESLREYYSGAQVPHVTVSVSSDGKPVDTGKLEFHPCEKFQLVGVIGVKES